MSLAPDHAAASAPSSKQPSLQEIVGSDPSMLHRLQQAQRLHARGLPLLLQGESGCGKTQLARQLHESGPHHKGGFVSINCAALPADLIESELFGHRPGAFTGAAKQGAPGRLIGAHDGTLFLDEIGDMPLPLQGRLLQVLSEGEFVPVGAVEPVQVRFALISASLRDLRALVQEGRFREDLYFRLSGATLALPALRQRSDRLQLIERAFARASREAGMAPCMLSEAARSALMRHHWPGNMRELQHVARFALAISDTALIDVHSLPSPLGDAAGLAGTAPHAPSSTALRPDTGRETLASVLERNGWNVSAAADELGVSRATLHRRLNDYGMHRPRRTSRVPPTAH